MMKLTLFWCNETCTLHLNLKYGTSGTKSCDMSVRQERYCSFEMHFRIQVQTYVVRNSSGQVRNSTLYIVSFIFGNRVLYRVMYRYWSFVTKITCWYFVKCGLASRV